MLKYDSCTNNNNPRFMRKRIYSEETSKMLELAGKLRYKRKYI
jgi:hypothetical protein